MHSSPSTADQLREARLRIAALEKELDALRASSASKPTLLDPAVKHSSSTTPHPTTPTAQHPSTNNSKSILDAPAAYSDISRDQSQRSTTRQDVHSCSPIPLSPKSFTEKRYPSPTVSQNPSQSHPMPTTPITATPTLTPIPTPSPSPNLATTQPSSAPLAPHSSSFAASSLQQASVSQPSTAKRRPPPLPTSKTSATKKDRPTLVAKCVEPRPGQTRYWTGEEHERFLEAIAEYGEKAYVAISNFVETRTPKQVRTHAQKFQMKMARLARQNLEAGQPIQMPRGMYPVIEVPVGSKSTIVPLTPEQSAKLSARASNAPLDQKSIMSAISVIPLAGKKRGGSGKGDSSCSQDKSPESPRKYRKTCGSQATVGDKCASDNGEVDEEGSVDQNEKVNIKVDEVSDEGSTVEDDSIRSKLNEDCADFGLVCGVAATGVETELESKLAAKLEESLVDGNPGDVVDVAKSEFLVSERSTNGSSSSVGEDDLEDLEKLEDGDLSLASFVNSDENWFLCDSSPSPSM